MATELEAAGEVAVSSGGASPGPWAAILRCHHTPTPRSGDTGHWAECISVIIVGGISLYSYLHHIISFVRTTSTATVGFR